MTAAKRKQSKHLHNNRDAFCKLNLVDEDILRDIYPNGCTLAEAEQVFEAISCAETNDDSILDDLTTSLLDSFIEMLDSESAFNKELFKNITAEQSEVFRHSLKLIICSFRNQDISAQGQLLAAGLVGEPKGIKK